MKANSFARGILRIRAIMLCLAIVGLAVAEVGLGSSLATRYGEYSGTQTGCSQAPGMSLGDLMAAAPVVR